MVEQREEIKESEDCRGLPLKEAIEPHKEEFESWLRSSNWRCRHANRKIELYERTFCAILKNTGGGETGYTNRWGLRELRVVIERALEGKDTDPGWDGGPR